MFDWLQKIKTWLEKHILYGPVILVQPRNSFESNSKKTLDEMTDVELRNNTKVPDVIRGDDITSSEVLIRERFRKLNTILLNYNLHRWEQAAVEALRIVASETKRSLQDAFDTYEIFVAIPVNLGHRNATVWIRSKDQNYRPLRDRLDNDTREKVVKTEITRPKARAAKAK